MPIKKLHIAEQYALDVVEKKKLSNKYEILACERYFNMKSQAMEKGWYHDSKSAQRTINFFERMLKHYQGKWAGKPFLLLPWQQFILWNIYGWYKADKKRLITEVSVFVPRKNGKTELVAGCGLYGMGFDGEKAPEVYSTATDKEQARIAFDKAKAMLKQSDILLDYLEPLANAIAGKTSPATFKPWSSDTSKKDGYNPSFASVDEYHEHPDNRMVDVIESGLGARENPIVFKITTAGFNPQSVCYKHQQVCQEILEGKKQQDNLFTIIYTCDKDDDWEKEETWIKANPSWFEIDTMQNHIRSSYQKAKNEGDSSNFKTKHLNVWTRAAKIWIEDKIWQSLGEDYTEEDLLGEECFGGLDLSDTEDISSFALFFPAKKRWLYYFFIPEESLEKNDDYKRWAADGHLITTPGNVIDYDYIRKKVSGYYINKNQVAHDEDCLNEKFFIQSIAFDRWGATQIQIKLTEDGITMSKFGQGFVSMNYPTKELKKMITGKEFSHNNNPVMRWMIGNISIKKDSAGNIKIDKDKSKNKVDGPVSSVMALGESISPQDDTNSIGIMTI